MANKEIKYSEPAAYFPKAIRDKYFGKKTTTKKTKPKTKKP